VQTRRFVYFLVPVPVMTSSPGRIKIQLVCAKSGVKINILYVVNAV